MVAWIVVKLAVFVSTKDSSTELQSSWAISEDTFFSVSCSANYLRMGFRSVLVSVLFPV